MFFGDENRKENSSPTSGRNLHATYHYKPKPALQLASQHAAFDEKGRSYHAFSNPGNPESIPAVPTTWDTVYDPSHPDADWTGLVQKIPHKKHINDHIAMQEGIERNEYGIISKEERQEWARKRAIADSGTGKNAGSLVIGGIDNPHERYTTSYKRFETHERTSRDQLTLEKRTNPVKRLQDPLNTTNPSPRGYMTSSPYPPEATNTFNQSRKDVGIHPRASLLSGIGEKLVASNSSVIRSNPEISKQSRPNESYRVLTTDNYNPVPGESPISLICLDLILSCFFRLHRP